MALLPPGEPSCSDSQERSRKQVSVFPRMRSGAAPPAPLVAAGPTRSVFTAAHHSGPREDRRKTFAGASTDVTPTLGSFATASADSLEKNASSRATHCPLQG